MFTIRQPVWVAVILLGMFTTAAAQNGTFPENVTHDANTVPRTHPSTSNGALYIYRTFISPIDGNRCPMYPSCSSYSAHAFKKHGFLKGWIMTCDRLMRCGRTETKNAEKVWVDDKPRAIDPVENNDFWWFNRNEKLNIIHAGENE